MRYIRSHVVEAKPMTRGEYNALRGWTLPLNENGEDEGYYVAYPDAYISWCPKEQFEAAANEYPDMEKLISGLSTTKYTKIYKEIDYKYNAPHKYAVLDAETNELLNFIHFQEGPIKEAGVNGVCGEDLINMVIDRLSSFQNSPYACEENAKAIEKFTEGLFWLRKRTMDREAKGIEGTSKTK